MTPKGAYTLLYYVSLEDAREDCTTLELSDRRIAPLGSRYSEESGHWAWPDGIVKPRKPITHTLRVPTAILDEVDDETRDKMHYVDDETFWSGSRKGVGNGQSDR